MSEGINFSDSLGRCVVIVGLPFPNAQTAEWKAKLEYIEASAFERSGRPDAPLLSEGLRRTKAKEAAREFLENSVMRAVNQSVGRAIRHKGDYASILLLDRRYTSERVQGKLPAWIQEGLRDPRGTDLSVVCRSLEKFFENKVSPR